MAITFISFLGTGNYNEVSYIDENGNIFKTKYIQSALLQKYKDSLNNGAHIKIFVTQEARKTHWEPQNTLKDELTVRGQHNSPGRVKIIPPGGRQIVKSYFR